MSVSLLEFYQRNVTDGMRSFWKLPFHVDSKSFQEVITVAKKIEDTVRCFMGCPFKCHPGAHAPIFSVTDCDKYIEWKLSSTGSSLHVYVKEDNWRLFIEQSSMENVSETECAIICTNFPLSSRSIPPGNWWLNRQRRWDWVSAQLFFMMLLTIFCSLRWS